MKTKKRGQSSTELIIVIAIFLVVLIAVMALNKDVLDDTFDTFKKSKIKTSLKELSTTAERVYQQGYGAKSRVFITLPSGINSSSVGNRTVSYTLDTGKVIFEISDVVLNGDLPINEGGHWVNVMAGKDVVSLYTDLFSLSPNSIYKTLYRLNTSSHLITVQNYIEEFIDFDVTYAGDPEVNIVFSKDNFSVPNHESDTVDAVITIFDNVSYGRYYGEIMFSGVTQTSGKQVSTIIPVTLDVVYVDFEVNDTLAGVIGILPRSWVVDPAYSNQEITNEFIAYSGFSINKTLDMNITGSVKDWLSFTPWPNTTSSLTVNIEPRSYTQFNVYLKPPMNSTEGDYTSIINGEYIKDILGSNITMQTQSSINITLVGDYLGPKIENITVNGNVLEIWDVLCVSANITDNIGVDSATVKYIDPDNVTRYVDMNYGNCTEGRYSTPILLSQTGRYNIIQLYAYDFSSNLGYNDTNITVDSIFVSYGGQGFNGTVTENPDDLCWLGGGRTWNSSLLGYISDNRSANIPDDGWSTGACATEGYDFVQFNFGNLSVIDRTITNVYFAAIHKGNKDTGTLPSGIEHFASRMMFQCYNGNEWMDMQPYPVSESGVWTNFSVTDISTCVKDNDIANNLTVRLTFDPEGDTNASQQIDYVSALVETNDYYLMELWPGNTSFDTRVDFSSSLESTNNTFYVDDTTLDIQQQLLANNDFTGPLLTGWVQGGSVGTASGGSSDLIIEDFESSNWDTNWAVTENGGVISRDSDQYAGSYGLGFSDFGNDEGDITRSLDLSGYSSATLNYRYALEDLENGDEGFVDIYDGSWNNAVRQLGPDNNGRHSTSPGDYLFGSIDLSAYTLSSDFRVRFRSSAYHAGGSDKMLIDDISIAVPGEFGLTDYWYVNGSLGDEGSLTQNFTIPSDSINNITLSLKHSGNAANFFGTAYAYCNLTHPGGEAIVWNETWTSDIHADNPITEEIDIIDHMTSDNFTYGIKCGADVENGTVIAFDDMGIVISYSSGSPTDDGWDWQDDTYGKDGSFDSSFVRHSDPSGLSGNVLNDYIGVRVGGAGSGTTEVMASGAFGIEFEVSQGAYRKILNESGKAIISFNYRVIDLLSSTNGVGTGGVWVKGRVGKQDQRNYLGSDLDNDIDSTLHYTDETDEIWTTVDFEYPGWSSVSLGNGTVERSFSQDITDLITGSGRYYLDLGGKVSWIGGSKANDEGVSFYFDNIRILVIY